LKKIIYHNALILSRIYYVFNVSYTFQIVESNFSYTSTLEVLNTFTITLTILIPQQSFALMAPLKRPPLTELRQMPYCHPYFLAQGSCPKFQLQHNDKVHKD